MEETIKVDKTTRGRLNAFDRKKINKEFWANVYQFAKEKDYTIQRLCQEIDKPTSYISNAKLHDSDFSTKTVFKIADVLHVSVEDLIPSSKIKYYMALKPENEILLKAKDGDKEAMTNLFSMLPKRRQEAIIIHVFSLLGVNPKTVIRSL